MSKERKPKTVVMLIELEDNCGAIVAKAKHEIEVEINANVLDEGVITNLFHSFVASLPVKIKL